MARFSYGRFFLSWGLLIALNLMTNLICPYHLMYSINFHSLTPVRDVILNVIFAASTTGFQNLLLLLMFCSSKCV